MAFAFDFKRIAFPILATAATALLVWFGTGLNPLWPLLWFAPLPILLVASRNSAWVAALIATAAWSLGNLNRDHYYATSLQVPLVGRIVIVLGQALVFALAVVLYRALLRRGAPWCALVAFPAVWVAFEYIFNLTSVHGTAISLSYSQLNFLPILQLASVTGPWGISFVLLASSSALAIGVSLRKTHPRRAIQIVAATLGTIALVLVFGAVRLALPPPPNQQVKVGLVASDAGPNKRVAAPGEPTSRLLNDYAAQAVALSARGAQVIVLPEHLGEITDAQVPAIDAIFQPIADKSGSTIVVGVGHESQRDPRNQARIYAPHEAVALYNKHHLLPPWESRFTPGTTLTTLPETNTKWGVAICKDMDFTPLSRQYGQTGVGLMLVPGWDFVLDRVSHGHMAIMRGVESGFAIARAGRGGSLMVTDNRGRILGETASNSAPFATLLVDVPAVHDRTIYQRFGDWFAFLTLAVLAFTLVRVLVPRVP